MRHRYFDASSQTASANAVESSWGRLCPTFGMTRVGARRRTSLPSISDPLRVRRRPRLRPPWTSRGLLPRWSGTLLVLELAVARVVGGDIIAVKLVGIGNQRSRRHRGRVLRGDRSHRDQIAIRHLIRAGFPRTARTPPATRRHSPWSRPPEWDAVLRPGLRPG